MYACASCVCACAFVHVSVGGDRGLHSSRGREGAKLIQAAMLRPDLIIGEQDEALEVLDGGACRKGSTSTISSGPSCVCS